MLRPFRKAETTGKRANSEATCSIRKSLANLISNEAKIRHLNVYEKPVSVNHGFRRIGVST